MEIPSILVFILCVAIYRFILNLVRYLRCKHFLQQYYDWLKDRTWDLVEHQSEVTDLFTKAGTPDSSVPHVQPVGYGQIMNTTASVFANFPSHRQDVANIIVSMFHRSIGVYRKRMWQSINPFSWIEFLIYLPQNLISFLGVTAPNFVTKSFQLVYWLIAVVFAVASTLYTAETRSFLDSIFKVSGGH